MKNRLSLAFLITLFISNTIFAFAASSHSSLQLEGVWRVTGNHDRFGVYNGLVEIRKSEDGIFKDDKFSVTRIITYKDYHYGDYQVSEVWTGLLDSELNASFTIGRVDFIVKLNSEIRTEDERAPLKLNSKWKYEEATEKIVSTYNEQYREYLEYLRPGDDAPIFKIDRFKVATNSKLDGLTKRLIDWMAKSYRDDSYVSSFNDRQEFVDGIHYSIHDRTDFKFYQHNSRHLRLVNKIVDNISLEETKLKADSYSKTLEDKARYFDFIARDRHINNAGMVVSARMKDGEFLSYVDDNDSALWTGTYVVSQLLRFKVTGAEEALKNAKKSLKGLFTLMDITGDPTTFGRTMKVANSPLNSNWVQGRGAFSHLIWKKGSNNDMFKGIIYAFLMSYLHLPASETQLRAGIKARVLQLTEAKTFDNGNSFGANNIMFVNGLAAMIVESNEFYQQHKELLRDKEFFGDFRKFPEFESSSERAKYYMEYDKSFDDLIVTVPITVGLPKYVNGISDWSGNHLNMISSIISSTIASQLDHRFAKKIQKRFYKNWKKIRRTRVPMYTFAVRAFGNWESTDQDEWYLNDAVWSLREFPCPQPTSNFSVDHSIKDEWVLSPVPRLPWKYISGNPGAEYGYQGIYGYPLFQMGALSNNYSWKSSPFGYRAGSSSSSEESGVDYLHAYWMARYHIGEIR
jgi:hypothetical protein